MLQRLLNHLAAGLNVCLQFHLFAQTTTRRRKARRRVFKMLPYVALPAPILQILCMYTYLEQTYICTFTRVLCVNSSHSRIQLLNEWSALYEPSRFGRSSRLSQHMALNGPKKCLTYIHIYPRVFRMVSFWFFTYSNNPIALFTVSQLVKYRFKVVFPYRVCDVSMTRTRYRL